MKVSKLKPFRFSGDENTFCRLEGAPADDVGLIFDRTQVNAKMSVANGLVHLPHSCVHYIFDVTSGDTVKLDYAADLSVGQSLLVSVWRI